MMLSRENIQSGHIGIPGQNGGDEVTHSCFAAR